MEIQVRFFASLADRTGCRSETVQLREAADVAALWGRLVERHPPLGEIGFRPLVACDMTWAEWDRPLEGVREVAFLPPVSGG